MPVEVIMPKVDMDMAHGKIALWHVAEGAAVEKGAPLFDIETDKAAMEVEAPASGILRHVRASEGAEIAIGTAVAWIYAEGEVVEAAPKDDVDRTTAFSERAADAAAAVAADKEPVAFSPASSTERPRATPAARRIAEQAGLDLARIIGTGPRGRVQKGDVEALLAAPPEPTPEAASGVAAQAGAAPLPAPARLVATHVAPFVLIHGFAADAAGWMPLEKALGRDRPILKLELPGHGRSPAQALRGFPDLVANMRRAFDALDLAAAHLVGHSLGGAVALALADTRPRTVRSLSLISPAGLGPEIDGAAINGIATASRVESLAPWLSRLMGDPKSLSWSFAQAAMLGRGDPALRAAQVEMAEVLFPDGVQGFDLSAALERLEMPARIIWGKRDKIIPWHHALSAQGAVSLNLFSEVGHVPHLENPEAVAALVAATAA